MGNDFSTSQSALSLMLCRCSSRRRQNAKEYQSEGGSDNEDLGNNPQTDLQTKQNLMSTKELDLRGASVHCLRDYLRETLMVEVRAAGLDESANI